jgi:hypothetical protein
MKRPLLYLLVALALILFAARALAALEALGLSWWTVDGGGGLSSGGDYALIGSLAQPDAGRMQGGDFSLASGFLSGASAPPPPARRLFLPLVVR